jgi:hypothetical protein
MQTDSSTTGFANVFDQRNVPVQTLVNRYYSLRDFTSCTCMSCAADQVQRFGVHLTVILTNFTIYCQESIQCEYVCYVAVFWDVAPYGLYVNHCLRETHHLHLQCRRSVEQEIGMRQFTMQFHPEVGGDMFI